MNNIRVYSCTLGNPSGSYDWSADRTANRGVWPHEPMEKIDYACTRVYSADENKSFILDLTLERS